MTRWSCVAGGINAIIDILAAVITWPAIDTHAVVSTLSVEASATILTGVGHQVALIDIFGTELTYQGTQDPEDPWYTC